ncbi:piwi-like protein 1 isoform X1 [Gigantopelta aegis]|uniref:piwi-like protein 1 isoform X1 n=1 Tax=Gigantopelta aegis TaxID=1735272 RepID=UPI001B88C365|nr:piwi-like protein 1 isoform X1 [Gigantopelta aegis]
MPGKARGRARGRARGGREAQETRRPGEQQPQLGEIQEPRRPGEQQPQQAPATPLLGAEGGSPPDPREDVGEPFPALAAGAVGPAVSSGRAAYRGGAREPRPGMAGEVPRVPVEEMQRMAIGTGEASATGHQRAEYGDLTTRPAHIIDKKGTSGRPIELSANYFRLETAPNLILYQYHVDYNPPIESRRLKAALLGAHEELLGKVRVFDGMILYLLKRLHEKKTEVYSTRQYDGEQIRITITLTNELPPNSPQFIQVANIIFRRILSMIDMKQIGRNYFNPTLSVNIPRHRLQVMPGFTTSILQYETSVLLGIDVAHKILRTDTVLDIMYEMYERGGASFYDDVFKKFVGSIVLTRYNNKTYRCDDIEWDKHPKDTFKMRDGSDISYKDYYKQHYNITITDDEQPLLVSKPSKSEQKRGHKDPIYLLPELCTLTGLSEEVRSDFHVMKDVATHTRLEPSARSERLYSFINKISQNEEVAAYLRDWRMRFSDRLMKLQARILPQEKIIQGNNAVINYRQEDAEWSRDMRGKQLLVPVRLQNWVVIGTRRDTGLVTDLVSTLNRVGPPMGMFIDKPRIVELPNDRNDSYIAALRENISPNVQMVLCVCPSSKKDRYDAIKKTCCIDHPIPSQVVLTRTISKKQMLMSVATKIAIQLNCKLGGEVWAVEIPLQHTMVIGIDTYHDSSSKGRSVGGVVCSVNRLMTRYYSKVTFQHNHQELIDGLEPAIIGGLRQFHAVNGVLPEKIIVYRDGVGDGQLPAVFEHEVPQMIQAMKKCRGHRGHKAP